MRVFSSFPMLMIAVILNEHLTKALRLLKRASPSSTVDKQIVTNFFLQFLCLPREDTKRFEILNLIASLLEWNDEQRQKAGLARSMTKDSSFRRTNSNPMLADVPQSPGERKEVLLIGDTTDGRACRNYGLIFCRGRLQRGKHQEHPLTSLRAQWEDQWAGLCRELRRLWGENEMGIHFWQHNILQRIGFWVLGFIRCAKICITSIRTPEPRFDLSDLPIRNDKTSIVNIKLHTYPLIASPEFPCQVNSKRSIYLLIRWIRWPARKDKQKMKFSSQVSDPKKLDS